MNAMISRVTPKNLSVYWVISTGLAVWFLFIHSPPMLRERFDGYALSIFYRDPFFALHLTGAYIIYIACIHNTLLTPSCLNGDARTYHVYVGRIGMIAGVVGFVLGAYCAWSPSRPNHDQGFAIGITIGGVMQLMAQAGGYFSIRKYQRLKQEIEDLTSYVADEGTSDMNYGSMDESGGGLVNPSTKIDELTVERDEALKTHIKCMIGLFAVACGIPALLRIVGDLGSNAIWVSIAVVNVMAIRFERFYTKRME